MLVVLKSVCFVPPPVVTVVVAVVVIVAVVHYLKHNVTINVKGAKCCPKPAAATAATTIATTTQLNNTFVVDATRGIHPALPHSFSSFCCINFVACSWQKTSHRASPFLHTVHCFFAALLVHVPGRKHNVDAPWQLGQVASLCGASFNVAVCFFSTLFFLCSVLPRPLRPSIVSKKPKLACLDFASPPSPTTFTANYGNGLSTGLAKGDALSETGIRRKT